MHCQVLSSKSLTTFSLVDAADSLLGGRTLEVLGPSQLAGLWLIASGVSPPHTAHFSSAPHHAQALSNVDADATGSSAPAAAMGSSIGCKPSVSPACATANPGHQGGRKRGWGSTKQAGGRGLYQSGVHGRGPAGRSAATTTATTTTSPAKLSGASTEPAASEGHTMGSCREAAMVVPEGGSAASGALPLAPSPRAAAARLACYSLTRTQVVRQLMHTLATIPDAFEMARVTGLSLTEVQYKAQMVRAYSLILRNARRHGSVA